MLKFNATSFYTAVSIMRRAHAFLEKDQKNKTEEITSGARNDAPKVMTLLETCCQELGANVTRIAVSDLISAIKSRKRRLTRGEFADRLKEVDSTLRRELSLVSLFVLPKKQEEYFDPKLPLFGPDFVSKFPSAAYELDEAGKCLALERPTAAAFHLMRIMEIGILSVARCLNVPDPTKPAQRN
jgi:hypothetical protein